MKKILLIGPEVTDFLNPLASKLKDLGYKVDLLETRKIPRSNLSISESYSTVLNFNELVGKRITFTNVIKYLFTIDFYRNLLKTIFFNCLEGKCKIIKSIRNTLAVLHSKDIFSPILNKYDIIHFHSLTSGLLSFVNYINQDKKIILSYWGSDLFQIWGSDPPPTNELKNYNQQLEALKRANIITVFNYEMERVVIAKFGPEMKNKIVRAILGFNDEIFDKIDEIKKISTDLNFLINYDIPENKIKITVGYCGDPICNHLLILDELDKTTDLTKEKIHLLVPMTYGNFSSEYLEEVKLRLNQTKISYTIFDKFLSLDELAKLRVSSDIMIMMNKSDALSASVCESLYADNILISAIWLPYSPFRLEKIFFYETDFRQLGQTVNHAVNKFEKVKVKLIPNPDRIKKLSATSITLQQWVNIFDSL